MTLLYSSICNLQNLESRQAFCGNPESGIFFLWLYSERFSCGQSFCTPPRMSNTVSKSSLHLPKNKETLIGIAVVPLHIAMPFESSQLNFSYCASDKGKQMFGRNTGLHWLALSKGIILWTIYSLNLQLVSWLCDIILKHWHFHMMHHFTFYLCSAPVPFKPLYLQSTAKFEPLQQHCWCVSYSLVLQWENPEVRV